MGEVVWSAPAFEDLEQVQHFIARDSTRYAAITVSKIRDPGRRAPSSEGGAIDSLP